MQRFRRLQHFAWTVATLLDGALNGSHREAPAICTPLATVPADALRISHATTPGRKPCTNRRLLWTQLSVPSACLLAKRIAAGHRLYVQTVRDSDVLRQDDEHYLPGTRIILQDCQR